jgi:predicted component of type VI protein secretion system
METITATDLAASPIGQIILKVYTPDAKTKDLKRKSDLKIIKDALKEYAKGHENRYPILTDTSKDSKFLEILVPKYLSKVPLDPINNSEYYYGYKCKDGRTYKLYCTLENNADSESKDGLYQLTN